MKLSTLMLGSAAAIAATSVGAQYNSPPPQQAPRIPEQGSADQAKQPQLHPSSGALKAIVELQKAVNNKDVANIPAKLSAAQAVAKTKEDKYIVGQLQIKAALDSKNNAALAAGIDAVAASGFLDAAKMANLYMALGSSFYEAKQFDQAAASFEKAATLDPRNPDLLLNLGETRFAQGRKADAVGYFQRAMQMKLAAGTKPDEALYKRAVGVAYEANLPVAAELGRQWVAAYPGPESWRNAIAIYRNVSKPDVEGTLDLLRLMQATNSLSVASDYSLYIEAAADQMNFNEAHAILNQGVTAKAVNPANPLFKDIVAGLKTKPATSEADLNAALKMNPAPTALIRIGDRFAASGNNAKAIEVYRAALAKPGVDKDVANLHLGMALARSGDKAGATAAFQAVTGPRSEIAKFWLVYVNGRA